MMFFLNFSTRQIETLMMNFDHDNIGEISLSTILGAAQLHHDKWKRTTDELITRKRLQLAGLDRSIGRLEYTRTLENSRIKDMEILAEIMEVLRRVSYNFVTARNILRTTLDRSIIMNSAQFKRLLQDLDINLTLKQFRVLQKHYWTNDLGGLNFLKFRVDFISLGVQLLIQSEQSDALGILIPTPGLGLVYRCDQSDIIGTSTSRCRLNILEYEDAVSKSSLVSTVFRARSSSPDRRRNKLGSGSAHEKKYTFNTYDPRGVKLPHTAPSLDSINDNKEDELVGNDFNHSGTSPRISDQLKLDRFLDAFFGGGGRVSFTSSSILSPVSTTEHSPVDSSSRPHTGVGNRIWHCDKHDEYTFNNRSPKGKKLESSPQSTPVNTYMQISPYLHPSVHPCELTRSSNAVPIIRKSLRISDTDNQVKLQTSVHSMGRRKMKAISSPGGTTLPGVDISSGKKVSVSMQNTFKCHSADRKMTNSDLVDDSNSGLIVVVVDNGAVCGDSHKSLPKEKDFDGTFREYDVDLISGVKESSGVCDDVTIDRDNVRTVPQSGVRSLTVGSLEYPVEAVSSTTDKKDLVRCNNDDEISILADGDTSTSTSIKELNSTNQNILTIWTEAIRIPLGPETQILDRENVHKEDLEPDSEELTRK